MYFYNSNDFLAGLTVLIVENKSIKNPIYKARLTIIHTKDGFLQMVITSDLIKWVPSVPIRPRKLFNNITPPIKICIYITILYNYGLLKSIIHSTNLL